MAKKSNSRRRKKQQKHAAKRKQKRKQAALRLSLKRHPSLQEAASWPLHEVLLSAEWRDPKILTQIIIVREGPDDNYAFGGAVVDQACLGVKTAFARVVDYYEYRFLRDSMLELQDFIEGDVNLVAKIIREAIAYAGQFDLRPDPDVKQVLSLIPEADPDACPEEIPLGGIDGKPLFIAGPYDNIPKILRKLEKHAGFDNFDYLLPLEGTEEFGED